MLRCRTIGWSWAYVAMSGSSFSEAVTVIVAEYDGVLLVRDIEWGRP
jgi:hypothetical protein